MLKKNVFSTAVAFAAIGITFGFSAAGCSSDDEPAGTGGSAGTSGSGGSGAKGGSGGSSGTGTAIDCKASDGIAKCKAEAFKQGSCEEVGGCACQNCCQEMSDCQADTGCVAIRDCANEKGCRAIACYQDNTCKAVIDANGGPTGIPATLGLALSTCVEMPCPVTKCGGGGAAGTGGSGTDAAAGKAGSGGTAGSSAGDASPG